MPDANSKIVSVASLYFPHVTALLAQAQDEWVMMQKIKMSPDDLIAYQPPYADGPVLFGLEIVVRLLVDCIVEGNGCSWSKEIKRSVAAIFLIKNGDNDPIGKRIEDILGPLVSRIPGLGFFSIPKSAIDGALPERRLTPSQTLFAVQVCIFSIWQTPVSLAHFPFRTMVSSRI